jgi:hypothetical protein
MMEYAHAIAMHRVSYNYCTSSRMNTGGDGGLVLGASTAGRSKHLSLLVLVDSSPLARLGRCSKIEFSY